MSQILFGICLCLAAMSIASTGIALQRKSKFAEGAQNQGKLALAGTIFMLLSAIPDVWVWALMPQVLVASMYTCRTVPVCLLGHFYLKERLVPSDWIGLLITITGTVLSVACGPHVTERSADPDVPININSRKITAYIILGSAVLVFNVVVASVLLWRRTGQSADWVLRGSWICLAAYVFVFEKVFNTLVGRNYDRNKSGLSSR